MANMSLAERDVDLLHKCVLELLLRRKQMAPLYMSERDVVQLYIDPVTFIALNKLDGLATSKIDEIMNHVRHQHIQVTQLIPGTIVEVRIPCPHGTHSRIGSRKGAMPVVPNSPGWGAFSEWLRAAIKIQVRNELVYSTVRRIIGPELTTYPQIQTALPETLSAITAQNAVRKRGYHENAPASKLVEVMDELRSRKIRGARKLKPEMQTLLNRRRDMIENTLAEAVLLKRCSNQGPGTPYPDMWISRTILREPKGGIL